MREWLKDERSWWVGKMFGGYEGSCGEFGGPIYYFLASNAAVSRSPNERYTAVWSFR